VLGLDYDEVHVADATRLEEFGDAVAVREEVRRVYGVDLGPELELPLWEALERIRRGPGSSSS
jgi:hypothetical protein